MSEITRKHCDEKYSIQGKLLMRRKMKPQQGNRNVEICQGRKCINALLKIKGHVLEIRLRPKKSHSSRRPTSPERRAMGNRATNESGKPITRRHAWQDSAIASTIDTADAERGDA